VALSDPRTDDAHDSKSAAISNLTVRLVKEYTGRGPTNARTHFNSDLITVLLRDTLPTGEKTLVAQGETVRVLDDNHIEPDVGIEAFVLAPVAVP